MSTAISHSVVLLAVICLQTLCLATDMRMCYFQSTARHRTNIGKFQVKDIDFTLCTHYIYAHACIDNATKKIVPQDPSAEVGPNGLYSQFTNGRSIVSSIKTMISVGGPYDNSNVMFEHLGDKSQYIDAFAASAVPFLNRHGFDGLDLDWVYPSAHQFHATHMNILKALRQEFSKYNGSRLILTSTVEGFHLIAGTLYTGHRIPNYVDYVVIKTHYLIVPNLQFAYFLGALFANTREEFLGTMCMNASVFLWHKHGLPYGKMVVGISGLGSLVELADMSSWEPGSAIKSSTALYDPLYNMSNCVAYPGVCHMMQSSVRYFDPVHKNPYLVQGSTWVGYEDRESIQAKLEYLKPIGVAGIMFAALDDDDFTGQVCREGKYPLLSFIKSYGKPHVSTTIPDVNGTSNVSQITTTIDTPHNKDNMTGAKFPTQKENEINLTVYIICVTLFILGSLFGYAVMFCVMKRKHASPEGEYGESH